MKKFKIEIEEILQNVYEVEANSLEEAISIIQEKYKNCEIVLDPETIKETNFREFK
jgi:hypothetical protein